MSYVAIAIDGDGFAKAAYLAGGGARQLTHRFVSRVFSLGVKHPKARVYVAWDRPDSADFRRARFDGYKAGRRKRPSRFGEDYHTAVAELREVLRPLGVASLEMARLEADDLLASVARRTPGGRRLVVTRDRDLLQLVTRDVDVLLRLGSKDTLMTVENVSEYLGVPVGLYRDWKALAGDGGDDVPGVPRVGAKTATALLAWNPKIVPETIALGKPQGTPPQSLVKAVERLTVLPKGWLETQRFLVSLHDRPSAKMKVDRGERDRAAAEAAFVAHGLVTLARRIGEWPWPRTSSRKDTLVEALASGDLTAVGEAVGVEFSPVSSSNLLALGSRGVDLWVAFRKGAVYRYPNGARLEREVREARSPGRRFADLLADGSLHVGERVA